MRLETVGLLLVALAASATLAAEWVQVDIRNVPVQRVTQNLERELAKTRRT